MDGTERRVRECQKPSCDSGRLTLETVTAGWRHLACGNSVVGDVGEFLNVSERFYELGNNLYYSQTIMWKMYVENFRMELIVI